MSLSASLLNSNPGGLHVNRFRKALIAVASIAMVLGTMGLGSGAAAASTTGCVSRAQFIYQFDVASGIAPVYPGTADFSDVPASSPYYGYIEAAYKAGIVDGTGNGMFSPDTCLLRDQIVKIEVIALGDQAQALKDMSTVTSFTDDASLPSWARGYIVEAVSLGLVKGYPDGSFKPGITISQSIADDFLAQYQAAASGLAFSVSASSTDVAPGQAVALSTKGAVGAVTYATTSGAIISGSTFVGSTPGTYTVTATSATGQTATVKIGVYGAATGLVINTPKTIVANGVSPETVAVDVVDANGNVVGDSTDQIALGNYRTVLGLATGAADKVDAVNGVATFSMVAGIIPGATETITATDKTSATTLGASATVTTTAQVPTSLAVSAPQYLDANSATQARVEVEVDDQTGNPMISGVYGVSVSLSGPATFMDGSTGPESGAYVASAGQPDATFTFTSIQAETGAITFTASATGLTSGTATTTAVIAGSGTAITVAPAAGTSFAEGSSGLVYDVQVVDAHGYPATDFNGTLYASVTDSSGNDVTGSYVGHGGAITVAGGAGSFTVNDTALGPDAGTYSLDVYDKSGALSSSSTTSFMETAGPVAKVVLSPVGIVKVAASSPEVTFTAQLEDRYGNDVSEAGASVKFTSAEDGGTYAYTLGGSTSDKSGSDTYTATTGSDGSATALFSAEPYTNVTYLVSATDTTDGTGRSSVVTVEVGSTIATNVSVATYLGGTQTSEFIAGQTITARATVTDQYGTPVAGDAISFTYNGTTLTASTGATGIATRKFTATTAGTGSVSVTDTSVVSQPTASATVLVNPGPVVGFDLFDMSGNDVSTGGLAVTANTPVELLLRPVDEEHNPTVTASQYLVALTGGTFRLSASGADVTSVTVPAGTYEYPIWYVSGASGTYTPLAAITKIDVSAPIKAQAGGSFQVTLTLVDESGNVQTGYSGTDTIVVTPVLAANQTDGLPTSATFTNGVATVSITLDTAGANGITVTDSTLRTEGSSGTIAVAPGPLTSLSWNAKTLTGNGDYVVTAEDTYGNALSGQTIYLAFSAVDNNGETDDMMGTAYVGATGLQYTEQAFITDANGQVTVSYTEGSDNDNDLPESFTDSINAYLTSTGGGPTPLSGTY